MPEPDNSPQRLRKPLLIVEFIALTILLGSMIWFSLGTPPGEVLAPAWLLVPALASFAVFTSFISLMYLRWVATANTDQRVSHKLIFALLALTMASVWIYGVANTWISLNAR